jgi:hypothetical protein
MLETDAAVAVADEPVTIEASSDAEATDLTPQPVAPESEDASAPATDADETTGTIGADTETAAVEDSELRAPVAETAEGPELLASVDATVEPPAILAEPEAPPQPAVPLGPEPTTMEELLAEQDTEIRSFKHGDVVEGRVVRIDKDEMLVDIGAKSEGVVSNRELFGRNAETAPTLAIGDTVLVYVLQPESPEGHAVLSLRRAGLER